MLTGIDPSVGGVDLEPMPSSDGWPKGKEDLIVHVPKSAEEFVTCCEVSAEPSALESI